MSKPLSRRTGPARALALALGLLATLPALGAKGDRDKPLEVKHADYFSGFNTPNSVTTLRGNVLIIQGTLKLSGDQARIHIGADQSISRVDVTGGPAHIEQLDDHGNLMQGTAHELDYDADKGVAVLSGKASVKQKGRGEAYGDKLTYDTRTSEMTGESAGHGGVHMIFQPKKHAAAPATAGSAAAPAAAGSAPASAPAASSGQH